MEHSCFDVLISNDHFSCSHRRNISLIRQLTRARLKPITRIITVFVVKRSDNKRQSIILITIVTILLLFLLFGYSSIFALYLYGHPFCLDSFSVGLLSLAQASTIFIASFLIVLCKKKLNDSYFLPLIGSFAFTSGLILFSVAKKIWLLYIGRVTAVIIYSLIFGFFLLVLLAVCIGSLFFITLPVLRTKLTRLVEANEYAVVFIAAGIVETTGHHAVGALANAIYRASLHVFPGLVFLVFATTGLFPLAIMRYDRYSTYGALLSSFFLI